MTNELKIISLKGKDMLPYINDLAQLRISVFREYPYLYEGDFDYESNYLSVYTESPEAGVALVFDKNMIVGASTFIPLEFETKEFQQPFINLGIAVQSIFYFGESVLLPPYRGKGIYPKFFDIREQAARRYGCEFACFCAVDRSIDDPRKPENYIPLDKLWQKIGYIKRPDLYTYYEWKEIGEKTQSPKRMTFWIKNL